MRVWGNRWTALLVASIGLTIAGCHETGDIEVSSLDLSGNQHVPTSKVTAVLATHQSGWLPWSPRHYFDRAEFEADLARVKAFYADRGYPHARIAGVNVALSNDRTSVNLHVTIDEGTPLVVERLTLTGFDVLPPDLRGSLDSLPLSQGQPRDREQVNAARDAALHALREHGFAYATVAVTEQPGSGPDRVAIDLAATPGPPTVFGPIAVTGLREVDEGLVRRSLAYSEGEPYRESLVTRSQRRLSALEVFDFVHVQTDVPAGETPPRVPTRITATEARRTRLEIGLGYGSEDRVRGSLTWRRLNVFGGGEQVVGSAKVSSTLSGASLTYTGPYPFAGASSLEVRGNAWWTHAPTYDSETDGGRATVRYRLDTSNGPHRREDRDLRLSVTYAHEFLRYALTKEAAADLSGYAERIALGLDPFTGRGSGTVASVGADLQRTVVDTPLNPTAGYGWSLHLEHAAPWLGGTFRFDEIRAETKVYHAIGDVVLAARGLAGTLVASDPTTVPFSSRYFLGGSSSLRGWGRYEVAPLGQQGVPIGGRSMVELSTEARFPIRGSVGGAVFLDAGSVGLNDWFAGLGRLRYAAGPGVRVATPVGVIRADFGIQLNPIAGLVINGKPQTRRWRIQFSIGQPF